jgi:hypothetical protein
LTVFRLPLGRTGAYLLGWGLLLGILHLRRRAAAGGGAPDPLRTRFWFLLAISVAPAALAWVLQVYAGAFEERYLVAAAGTILPAASWAWGNMFLGEPLALRLPGGRDPITVGGPTRRRVAVALVAAALVTQYLDPARWLRPSSPAREFAAIVESRGRPDDLIWIFPAPYASSFNFHFAGPQAQLAFPFRGRVTNVDWIALREQEQDPVVIARFLEELGRHLDRGRRVWAIFVESLPLDKGWSFSSGPAPVHASRLARAEIHVHRQALQLLYTRARVEGWWDRPHHDYHEGMVLALFTPFPR